ncbi:MAG: HAD hydrolase-like protein [Deltaproteobacteria bacterium]|nr:HAD hydrolase-like protein [Deltaproteobacteria bacterium]
MTSRTKKTALLFDIDGTLLLTGGAGTSALNRAFMVLYNEAEVFKDIDPHGRTDLSLIRECYQRRFNKAPTAEEIGQIRQKYCAYIHETLYTCEDFRLMPFVKKTLCALSTDPTYCLGLATGNFKESGFAKLKRGSIDHFFLFGGFGSDAEDRLALTKKAYAEALTFTKEKPARMYLIGDTVHDIRCGRAIGVKTIGVCTNNTPREVMQKEGADWVMENLEGFCDFLHDHRGDEHHLPTL